MTTLELIRHLAIGTPAERVANAIKRLSIKRACRKHPELASALSEQLYFEEVFREFISEDSNCVDVGAHLGAVLSAFQRLAPAGSHVAFEPTPYKAAWLRRKFPRVRIEEAAVSDHEGEAIFYHSRRSSAYSGLKVQRSVNPEETTELRVRCVRLDDVLGAMPVRFLKIDVEGAELLAMKGATTLIDAQRPVILFECTVSGLGAFGFRGEEVHQLLTERHQYEIFLPRPARLRCEPLNLREFQAAIGYPFQAWNFLALPHS